VWGLGAGYVGGTGATGAGRPGRRWRRRRHVGGRIVAGLTVIGRRGDGAGETDGVSRVAIVTQNAGALLASVRSLV
jgi:hypothetical protein